jgi:hypothetical protein
MNNTGIRKMVISSENGTNSKESGPYEGGSDKREGTG